MVAQVRGTVSESGAYAAALELLDVGDAARRASTATLDRLALGALLAAEARGLDVPARRCGSPAAPTATPAVAPARR